MRLRLLVNMSKKWEILLLSINYDIIKGGNTFYTRKSQISNERRWPFLNGNNFETSKQQFLEYGGN